VAQIARRSFCAGSAVTAYSVERYEKYCRFPRLTLASRMLLLDRYAAI
jgi:hypothetical protein